MRPISLNKIADLRHAKQNFCDCYLVASISALTKSENGRKILQNNILYDGENYCVKFKDVYGKPETYLVKQSECDELILMDNHLNPIPLEPHEQHNPIIKVLEVAMNKLLANHPFKKPLVCRIASCQEIFEYNKVSNFLKMFTGVRPITINESGIKMTLNNDKKATEHLLNRISEEKNCSFVLGTGYKGPLEILPHCYALNDVISGEKIVTTFDNRRQINKRTTFNETLKYYKFICGYFNDMLK